MKYTYIVDGKEIVLTSSNKQVAVRFKEPALVEHRKRFATRAGTSGFEDRLEVPGEKYTVFTAEEEQINPNLESVTYKNVDNATPVFEYGQNQIIVTDRIIIGIKGDTKIESIIGDFHKVKTINAREFVIKTNDPTTNILETVNKLREHKDVEYVEPDFITVGKRNNKSQNTDPYAADQYALEITKANEAHEIQLGDPSITIAIIDEGCDVHHPDISDAIIATYDAIDGDDNQDPNAWDGHGTACAGLAAAVPYNDLGIRGIGGGCTMFGIRMAYSEKQYGYWITSNSKIASAIDWAWENGADVLSNSWGGGSPSNAITNAIKRAMTQGRGGLGAAVVVAAGNASEPVDYPGNLDGVITVAATNEYDENKTETSKDGESWWGSNYGYAIDIGAPGVHNLTTDISGEDGYSNTNYTDFNGTSSACPIVAGAIGLMLSANPELPLDKIRSILHESADKVGDIEYINGRNDYYGYGRLNVLKALELSREIDTKPEFNPVTIDDYILETVLQKEATIPVGDNYLLIPFSIDETKNIQEIEFAIALAHHRPSDLEITLVDPSTTIAVNIPMPRWRRISNRFKKFNTYSLPELQEFEGISAKGIWILAITSKNKIGTFRRARLKIQF